jgi:uncharacterized protein YecE (DUF72 family)
MGPIRAGTGGWTYPPWRGVFYPRGTPRSGELAFASRRFTAIEINSTYQSTQAPETFARWADETPAEFIFTVKASRFCTNRRVLADAGEAVERFFAQGLARLGERLGPILWQFMATKRFDAADFAAFLALLPASLEGRPLRHCVEVRHASFATPEFVALCRERGVAICCSEAADWPLIADVTADFAYARLQMGEDAVETGYRPADLDAWARRLRAYAAGAAPADLPLIDPDRAPAPRPMEVFAFFIRGGKLRAPAAAMALLGRLSSGKT